MREYNIYAGLGGGFGGANYYSTILAKSQDEADEYAYDCAQNLYETYVGNRGLPTLSEIAENEGLDLDNEEDLDIANEIYESHVEDWIVYYTIPITEDSIEEESLVREHDSGETDSI